MGAGAFVVGQDPNDNGRRTSQVHTVMSSLQQYMPKDTIQDDEKNKMVHIIDVTKRPLTGEVPADIKCGDILEFKVNGGDQYDLFQVYKHGKDYYRVDRGYALLNIRTHTPRKDRRMLLSFDLSQENHDKTDLCFCVIPSSMREMVSKDRKCPSAYCELNHLTVTNRVEKVSLNDEKKNQKIYLYKGDCIELKWKSENGTAYHIEEKQYCPISGGLYTVERTSHRTYRKMFYDFGMSFLFRLTDANQVHDITVCVINGRYQIKHVEITDNDIKPDIIYIEQNDWIVFEWDTTREQTIVQIEPFYIDEDTERLIELKNDEKYFSWSHGPTRRGYMYHHFTETGLYCYKTANDRIGTIIVKPQKIIHEVSIFNDQLVYIMNTKDIVQFNWKAVDAKEGPILITIDPNSSVISNATDDRARLFDCSEHQCKIEPFFRNHFHTCEVFLLNMPRYGLYNIAYSNNPERVLISLIVENSKHTHRVALDEKNTFEPRKMTINRFDQVQFSLVSATRAGIIYQTDEYGNPLEFERILRPSRQNTIHYCMKGFPHIGIYYFSTNIKKPDRRRYRRTGKYQLAIIVLPEIRFHYKLIGKDYFDSEVVMATNTNDFLLWLFEKPISRNVIHLRVDETFNDVMSCQDRAIVGKNRRCLAVNCKFLPSKASFFANPDFEWVTGFYEDRLISTIIIDPPFHQNSFLVTNEQFVPNILYIATYDTVSWILTNNDQNHRIYVRSIENDHEDNENDCIDQFIKDQSEGFCYLHTFYQPGEYIIKSNRFRGTATVVVYPDVAMKKRQAQEPRIIEQLDSVIQIDTQMHLDYPNYRNATIYYTLDGSLPTQHNNPFYIYDSNEGAYFREPGFHLLRAYSTADRKISSTVAMSRPTFVLGNREQPSWKDCQIKLSATLKYPNTIYGRIIVKPRDLIVLIDYFELYINDVSPRIVNQSKVLDFSIDVYPAGIQSEIYVIAYPKRDVKDAKPISSHILAFEIKPRRLKNGDDRARRLLLILKQTIEIRTKILNSAYKHPHILYPGIHHYIDNKLSAERSVTRYRRETCSLTSITSTHQNDDTLADDNS